MRKTILPGLLVGLVMLVVGLAVGQLLNAIFPQLVAEYNNSAVIRPWSDPAMSLYFIEPFVTGLILAWIWGVTRHLFKGENIVSKGTNFGLVYWLATVPGMIMSFASFQLSLLIVVSWSVTLLVQALFAGWVLAKVAR